MTTRQYLKPYLSVEQQVELLRGRGMSISDQGRAEVCLHRIGYYRLSGYAYPFRHREIRQDANGEAREFVSEHFRTETTLSGVMELYVFDKCLRLLMLDAIERVEVALRVEIALILGRKGAFAHRDSANFNRYFARPDASGIETPHSHFLAKLDLAAMKSREEFAEHFRSKYDSPLPLWMAIELWDFGTLSTVLGGMQDKDLAVLASKFRLTRNNYLPSWAQSINFVRNICAHHGRLWNRPLVQQPKPPKASEIPLLAHLAIDTHAQRRVYAVAAVLQYLLLTVNPSTTWPVRLRQHVKTFPTLPGTTLRHMGFPDDWEIQPLWGTQAITAQP